MSEVIEAGALVGVAAPRRRASVLRRFARHRLALLGVLVILTLLVGSAGAGWLAPHDPDDIDISNRYAAPLSEGHPLGADDLGRDVLSRLMFAGQISLSVGIAAMLVTLVVGFAIGAFAAYHGGWLDTVLMRLTDMMLCFPSVFLLLFVAAFVTPTLVSIALMIGLTCWMEIARLVHAQILALKSADFIAAARMAGAPSWRIVVRQILPNTLAPILVAATLNTANAILLESYISFLGYGIQPPAASWGNMLTNAQSDFTVDPWLAVFPGLAITLAVASFNFIGDGLSDALDPRLYPVTALLEVRDLTVAFGTARAVDRVSFSLRSGETLGLVGESGCGKSTTALALMRLLHGAAIGGRAELDGRDLLALDEAAMRALRGAEIGMIFQDPMTALHPLIRAGDQVAEAIRAHRRMSPEAARAKALELFRKVGIAAPEQRLRAYPHELSGGMCQRVMIAAAIACGPRLLLADEPTTALDVTVQAQILDLIRAVSRESGTAVILITHDLGVVAGQADRVAVMYAGRIVEQAATEALFARPAHPYTRGLLGSVPSLVDGFDEDLPTIPGSVAAAAAHGCAFAPRCAMAVAKCREEPPLAPVRDGHLSACWRAGEVSAG